MKLTNLHFHLHEVHNIQHYAFSEDFEHTVYISKGKKFSFPMNGPNGEVDAELIDWGCKHLEVEVPNEVESELKNKLNENQNNKGNELPK